MFNLHLEISKHPDRYRQLVCGESLMSVYNCPLENKFEDLWSEHNYIVYVIEGKKIWHTAHGSYDLTKGKCVFVRKGACIVEQFFDVRFCLVLFFLPDAFIAEILKTKTSPLYKTSESFNPIIQIDSNTALHTFFNSMMPHFDASKKPDASLLDLKFRELILTLADNPANKELLSYFNTLMQNPQAISLKTIMEENFRFNLKLEEFAKLSAKSLSAFKRDFEKTYQTSPGKWLLEKRLQLAHQLLSTLSKTVGEVAFESGFENISHFSRAFRKRFGVSPTTLKNEKVLMN